MKIKNKIGIYNAGSMATTKMCTKTTGAMYS